MPLFKALAKNSRFFKPVKPYVTCVIVQRSCNSATLGIDAKFFAMNTITAILKSTKSNVTHMSHKALQG